MQRKRRTILAFGDSNTHGSRPGVGKGRYGPNKRWPKVMSRKLGRSWVLIEEGLPGRTTQSDHPEYPCNVDGRIGLMMALCTHAPVDLLVIMLGTNDFQTYFDADASDVVAGITTLVELSRTGAVRDTHPDLDILVVCPPPILENCVPDGIFCGAGAKSEALAQDLAALCETLRIGFLDAGAVARSSEVDGVHLGPEAHQKLGTAIAEKIQAMT